MALFYSLRIRSAERSALNTGEDRRAEKKCSAFPGGKRHGAFVERLVPKIAMHEGYENIRYRADAVLTRILLTTERLYAGRQSKADS